MKWPSHSMSTHPLWSKANQIFQCPNDVTSVNKNFLSYYYAPGTVQGTQRNRDEKNHDFMTCTSIHRKVKVMLRYKLVHEAVGDKKGDDKFYLWELRKSSQRRWNLGWVLKMSKYKPGWNSSWSTKESPYPAYLYQAWKFTKHFLIHCLT